MKIGYPFAGQFLIIFSVIVTLLFCITVAAPVSVRVLSLSLFSTAYLPITANGWSDQNEDWLPSAPLSVKPPKLDKIHILNQA